MAARLCPGRALEWRQRRGGEKKVAETLQGGEVSLPLCASVEVKLQTRHQTAVCAMPSLLRGIKDLLRAEGHGGLLPGPEAPRL